MRHSHGFNLLEMMIVLAIAAIALGIAVPSFQESIISSRTHGVAESVQGGLLLARSEAIKRNAPMRFQLVSTLDASCTASAGSRLWLVTQYVSTDSRGVPAGQCDKNAYMPPDQEEPCPTSPAYSGNAASCNADPFIAFKSTADSATNVTVSATPTAGSPAGFIVTFGPLGQLLANLEGAAPTSSPAYVVTAAPSTGFTGRTYRVQINSNGSIRLCDPLAASTSANACL